jgi:two-component system alkaline phosphatase synthesis response regulator PhoP
MASNKKTILIVDDDEDILELLLFNLKSTGYHIEIAKDGIEAIEVAKKTLPDLIIMDIMMPRMDGVEASLLHARYVADPVLGRVEGRIIA